MILIPNFGNRAPADGNSNAVLSGAVSIGSIILNPGFLGDVDDKPAPFEVRHHRMSSAVHLCPVPALNAAICDEWQVDIDVSLGGANAIATAATASITSTVGKKAGQDYFATADYYVSDSSGPNTIAVDIKAGNLVEMVYGRTAKEWSLPVSVQVSGTDCGFSFGIQLPSGSYGAAYTGITLTIAGQSVTLYDTASSTSAPTGTITLTPISWLPLA